MPTDNDLHTPFSISPSTGRAAELFPEAEAERTPVNVISLALVLQGEAEVEVDEKRHSLRPGTLVYLYPNHLVRMLHRTDGFRFGYLRFEFDFLSDFPLLLKADISEYAGSHPCLRLKEKDSRTIRKYLDLMAERWQETAHPAVVKGLFFSLILEVSRIYSGANVSISGTRRDELTDRFFFLLHQHYREERSAAFYADKLCISDKYLMRVLKLSTGRTFHFWVTEFVLREAKLLLRSTALGIAQIAERLNYPNPSFFTRAFRRHEGMTPTEFRNR